MLVGLPVVVVVIALAVGNTEWGRERLAALIRSATEGGPVAVTVGGITGPLPARIGLLDLRLSDRLGEFAAFERVDLAWSPWALLSGTVLVEAVEVAGGAVEIGRAHV